MSHDINLALLIGVAVLLVAVAAVRLSTRTGLPSLLVYLAMGVLIGESGLGIEFENVHLTQTLGTCALMLIIAEGGLTARWSALKPALPLAVSLATLGVVISVAVVGVVAHWLLDFDWRLAFLYGAVLASTDAAAVFSTLRRVKVRPRLAAVLEAESGINDASAVVLVIMLSLGEFGESPWWRQVLVAAYELGAGAAIGLAVGLTGVWLLRHAALPSAGLYPLAAVGLTVLAFTVGTVALSSGLIAVYVAGAVLGNSRIPHRQAILGFADGLAWLAQIGLFVLLGLLLSPNQLGPAIVPAIVVGVVLLVLARPASVGASVFSVWWHEPGRFGWRDQTFLSWAGLRGAVPIVFATIPLANRVPGAQVLFNAVFVLVVVFTLVQGTTLPWVARKLAVSAPAEPTDLFVDSAPLAEMDADLLQLEVPRGSRLAGVHLDELRLPVGAVVTLVLRDGKGFVPDSGTRLKAADSLLIVTTAAAREEAVRRLRAVSRRGRLARWFGQDGTSTS
jgi:cell volume regulation protein A